MNNKFLTIAGLAALSAANDQLPDLSLQELLNQANTRNDDADQADTNVMQSVVDHINDLYDEINSLETDLASAQQAIVRLENEQVIEEHFFINDEFRVPDNGVAHCFQEFTLPAGTSLDFGADYSTGWKKGNGTTSAQLMLRKNDEIVARQRHVKGVPGTWFTHTASLIYSEKNETEEDMSFKLCFYSKDNVAEMTVAPNMFQWGYKILGSGYNLIEHRFDASDMTIGD